MLFTSLALTLFSPGQRSPLLHFRIYKVHRRSTRFIVCTTFAKPFTSSSVSSGGYILPGNRTTTRVISHPLSRRATHRDTRAVGRRGSWEIYAARSPVASFLIPFGFGSYSPITCDASIVPIFPITRFLSPRGIEPHLWTWEWQIRWIYMFVPPFTRYFPYAVNYNAICFTRYFLSVYAIWIILLIKDTPPLLLFLFFSC